MKNLYLPCQRSFSRSIKPLPPISIWPMGTTTCRLYHLRTHNHSISLQVVLSRWEMNGEIISADYWKEVRNLFWYRIGISYYLTRSLLLSLEMPPRTLTLSSTRFGPISSSIIVSTGQIVVTIIANPMAAVTRWEVGISDLKIPSAQSVDIRGTDTCLASELDQFFRRRRSSKRISEILGIREHHPPHNFQLSKQ